MADSSFTVHIPHYEVYSRCFPDRTEIGARNDRSFLFPSIPPFFEKGWDDKLGKRLYEAAKEAYSEYADGHFFCDISLHSFLEYVKSEDQSGRFDFNPNAVLYQREEKKIQSLEIAL